MANNLILRKAIQKAVDNGFSSQWLLPELVNEDEMVIEESLGFKRKVSPFLAWFGETNSLIFRHDFAKAFWGEDKACGNCGSEMILEDGGMVKCTSDCEAPYQSKQWAYHLQQMVLEENPLQYLEKFL